MELIRRGNIHWVKLDPIEGSEIGKTRPGIVISNDINNELADIGTLPDSVLKEIERAIKVHLDFK